MAMALPLYYSAEMVRALPDDGNRYETVHGELLVSPAPRHVHQLVVARLMEQLQPYLRAHPVGVLLPSPADVSSGSDTLVQPDLFVVEIGQARTMEWPQLQHLLLAIEIVSPSSRRADRFTKRVLYQRAGIPDYWVVDIEAAAIERWTPDATAPDLLRDTVQWQPAGVTTALSVDIPALFAPI